MRVRDLVVVLVRRWGDADRVGAAILFRMGMISVEVEELAAWCGGGERGEGDVARPGLGSLVGEPRDDWPVQEQRRLSALLGDREAATCVRLTERLLMIPSSSVSHTRGLGGRTVESCHLGQRERCPSRKAPGDEGLYETRYRPESEELPGWTG